MTEQEEKEFEVLLNKKLKNQYSMGMLAGSVAMCTVVMEKINNKKISDKEKLDEIKKFCMTSLGSNKQ